LYNRLNRGGALLDDTLGPFVGPKVKAAFKTAEWAGQYGPEAQRVMGPTLQRTAYRYRGTERPLDARLRTAIINTRKIVGHDQSPAVLRHTIVYGYRDSRGNENSSPVVTYFRQHVLPQTSLNELQRMSGTIPPSHGIIIDKDNKIATQAVGYGDDWYLPFNLKKLGKLNGGEYIRTRTYGGPTTEDVYTGLMAGADSMTVVSHNGTYTVEFDPSFRKGRRYNDKAARMVARYGQLLDAVKSEHVRGAMIDPSRVAELEKDAEDNVGIEDPTKYEAELKKLRAQEMLRPKLSEEQKTLVKQRFIENLASRMDGGEGMTSDAFMENTARGARNRFREGIKAKHEADVKTARRTLRDSQAQIEAAEDRREDPDPRDVEQHDWAKRILASPVPYDEEAEKDLVRQFSDPDKLIDALGERKNYEDFEVRAEKQLRADMSPLRLNGQGYHKALMALQEQFPYYIRDIKFQPWKDMPSHTDTGYIKPRHIRPEGAYAGYFDESIMGHGKVSADSVARGKLRPVERAEKKDETGKPISTSTSTSTETSGKVNPLAARKAMIALAKHIAEVANSDDAVIPDNADADIKGKKVKEYAWLRDPNDDVGTPETRAIATIGSMSQEEIEDAFDDRPDEMTRKTKEALRANDNRHFLPLKDEIVEKARAAGAQVKEKELDFANPFASMGNKKSGVQAG
jgi:hypothetical protein